MARVAVLSSALLAGADAAYKCQDPALMLVSDSATKKCTGHWCNDAACCVDDKTKCGNAETFQGVCSDTTKTWVSGATGKDETECCVVAKAKCSSRTCPDGLKSKDGVQDELCEGGTCGSHADIMKCCVEDDTKCKKHTCSDTKKYVPGEKYGIAGTDDDTCCVDKTCEMHSCGSPKYKPESYNNKVGNDDATCCEDELKCEDFKDCGLTMEGVQIFESENPKNVNKYSPESDDLSIQMTCCTRIQEFCIGSYPISCGAGTKVDWASKGNTTDDCCVDAVTCDAYTMPGSGGDAPAAASAAEPGNSRLSSLLAFTVAALACVSVA